MDNPPSGSCYYAPPLQIVRTTGNIYGCVNGSWTQIGNGGGGGGGSTNQVYVVTTSGAYTPAITSSSLTALIKKTTPATTSVVLPAASNFSTCPATNTACPTYTIKDAAGNAATFAITITTSDGANIDGTSSYIINSNYQSVTMVFNGTTWSVL